jgi:heme-degrading monooxygenase HmoA
MFVVIWEYEVRPGSEPAFEALYGNDGAWVALFRQSPAFIGTELLRDEQTGWYVTIDRWTSAADYAAFLDANAVHYAQIDAQGGALTVAERRLGRYATC